MVLEKTLRVPWTARRPNQSILKEISPGCSLEGLMLKLKLQYFGHLMWRTDSFEKIWWWERLKVGAEGVDRGWDGWMASPTRWTWVWASSGSWWRTGKPDMLQSMGWQRVRRDWATELIFVHTNQKWWIILLKFHSLWWKMLKKHDFAQYEQRREMCSIFYQGYNCLQRKPHSEKPLWIPYQDLCWFLSKCHGECV